MEVNLALVNCVFGMKRFMEPLGISYLAAMLREAKIPGLKVTICEPGVEGDSMEEMIGKLIEGGYNHIGLSFITADIETCSAFLEKYRAAGGTAAITIGGHGPSLAAEKFLLDEVSAVFVGEGEYSFTEYYTKIANRETVFKVRGIVIRDEEGKPHYTGPAKRAANLDDLPFMTRDVLEQLLVKYPGVVSARIISSRGCYMFCEYCSVQTYARLQEGGVYRERSVENLLQEMDYLYKTYGITRFLFEDDNFLPRVKERALKKVEAFCEGVRKINIPDIRLHMQCRPDSVTEEVISKLRDAGLCDLFIGIENINAEDMSFFGRKSDVNQHMEAMEILTRVGFSCDINKERRLRIGYIIFNPESTVESIRRSVDFLRKYHVTPKKLINELRPYDHTKIREKFIERGYLDEQGNVRYRDPVIQKKVVAICDTVRFILKFRNKVRLPMKLNMEMELNLDGREIMKQLDRIRADCDNNCYKAAYEILDAGEEEIELICRKYHDMTEALSTKIDEKDMFGSIGKMMDVGGLEAGIYR